MKMLWSKEFVTYKGKYYTLRRANLYTKPETEVPLYIAAFGPKVAKIAGKYADGFLTTLVDPAKFRNVLLKAVSEGAREMGRDPEKIERTVELGVSYSEDYGKCVEKLRFWRGTLFPFMFKLPIYDPREIEEMGRMVSDEALAKVYFIATKPEEILKPIERAVEMGFNHVYLQSTSPDETKFMDMAAKQVVPYVKSTYGDK
jgi:alkanesulfonate monooxygenase SsuD/methylene tetrahydromethanopterin reductase-like flavin-dependent oxidoreductase (luciferase family)